MCLSCCMAYCVFACFMSYCVSVLLHVLIVCPTILSTACPTGRPGHTSVRGTDPDPPALHGDHHRHWRDEDQGAEIRECFFIISLVTPSLFHISHHHYLTHHTTFIYHTTISLIVPSLSHLSHHHPLTHHTITLSHHFLLRKLGLVSRSSVSQCQTPTSEVCSSLAQRSRSQSVSGISWMRSARSVLSWDVS